MSYLPPIISSKSPLGIVRSRHKMPHKSRLTWAVKNAVLKLTGRKVKARFDERKRGTDIVKIEGAWASDSSDYRVEVRQSPTTEDLIIGEPKGQVPYYMASAIEYAYGGMKEKQEELLYDWPKVYGKLVQATMDCRKIMKESGVALSYVGADGKRRMSMDSLNKIKEVDEKIFHAIDVGLEFKAKVNIANAPFAASVHIVSSLYDLVTTYEEHLSELIELRNKRLGRKE